MADIGIPSLNEFLTHVRQYNLARQERFFVEFTGATNVTTLALLCHQASIPGKTINTRALRINGLDRTFAHSADYMGVNGITLEFLIDGLHTPRIVIENWMEVCVDAYQSTNSMEVGWYRDYARDIILYTTTANSPEPDSISYAIKLVEAWPKTMNVTPLGWDSSGIQKMTVEFVYHHWETDRSFIKKLAENIANPSKPTTNETPETSKTTVP